MNKDITSQLTDSPSNFLMEMRLSSNNNAKMVSINKQNARDLINNRSKYGYIVVGTYCVDDDCDVSATACNEPRLLTQTVLFRVMDMMDRLRSRRYCYTPVFARYIVGQGTDKERMVSECSIIIYPYDVQGNMYFFDDLKRLGLELASAYNQDTILVKAFNQRPCYVDTKGEQVAELAEDKPFYDLAKDYFVELLTTKQHSEDDKAAQHFTYIDTFLNPGPGCYSESHVRYLKGEKALPYR